MAFKSREPAEASADSPELLFPLLPRTGANSPGLWYQQTDILRDYLNHVSARDLAIELPTGTGKTLTGLLVAEWRRRQGKGRAVFACPTVQLVKQVIKAAANEGIAVVDLSGAWKELNATDVMRYEAGRAIAVVSYSTVFNINPKLGNPDVLVFDDAHAGEQYVSGAYTVSISRSGLASVYEDLIEALKPGLAKERHSQLILSKPGVGTKGAIDALFPVVRDEWLEPVDHALLRLSEVKTKEARQQAYRHAAIRGHLRACSIFVTWDRIEIRPLIAPTFSNPVFSNATQRVYLSATLGAAGELERAFGRPAVSRLRLPESAPKPRSGRRFVVFPHLVSDVDPQQLTKQILAMGDRAVVITPSAKTAIEAEVTLVPDKWTIFRKDDVVESFNSFAATSNAVCVLANRYDGIDLPDQACRIVALYGLPRATSLQEEFLSSRARASAAIDERLRTRVVQGTGRCTRNPRDFALVVVADPSTTMYLAKSEVQSALDEDLQAEIRFGLAQSETTAAELISNIDVFLRSDPLWRTEAEPEVGLYRKESRIVLPAASDSLMRAAPFEVAAAEAAWNEDMRAAGESLHQAAEALSSAREARGYRAFLLFGAAVRMNAAGRFIGDNALIQAGASLADQSLKVATPATWMRSSMPLPGAVERTVSAADQSAVTQLNRIAARATNTAKHNDRIAKIREGLSAIDHREYEPALSELGLLLGATEAYKPKGDGRADSVWCFENNLWITLEAKSEHETIGVIGMDDVRQTNYHLSLLQDDRGHSVPDGALSVIISPRETLKKEAISIAEPFVFKLLPQDLLDLLAATDRLWLALLTLRNISDDDRRREAIGEALAGARLLPTDLIDRLTIRPIGEA